MRKLENIYQYFIDKYAKAGVNILDAILVLLIGWYLIKFVIKLICRMMEKSNIDSIVINFIRSIADIALKIILGITVMTVLTMLLS